MFILSLFFIVLFAHDLSGEMVDTVGAGHATLRPARWLGTLQTLPKSKICFAQSRTESERVAQCAIMQKP